MPLHLRTGSQVGSLHMFKTEGSDRAQKKKNIFLNGAKNIFNCICHITLSICYTQYKILFFILASDNL